MVCFFFLWAVADWGINTKNKAETKKTIGKILVNNILLQKKYREGMKFLFIGYFVIIAETHFGKPSGEGSMLTYHAIVEVLAFNNGIVLNDAVANDGLVNGNIFAY